MRMRLCLLEARNVSQVGHLSTEGIHTHRTNERNATESARAVPIAGRRRAIETRDREFPRNTPPRKPGRLSRVEPSGPAAHYRNSAAGPKNFRATGTGAEPPLCPNRGARHRGSRLADIRALPAGAVPVPVHSLACSGFFRLRARNGYPLFFLGCILECIVVPVYIPYRTIPGNVAGTRNPHRARVTALMPRSGHDGPVSGLPGPKGYSNPHFEQPTLNRPHMLKFC